MVSETRERYPSESQVEITLKAVENLLNGPKLLFHDRFKQCEYKIKELYDTIYQLDQNESLGIRYENISKSAQSSVDAYILSKQANLSNENVGHNGNAVFFAINDERPLSFLESESMTSQSAKNERRKKSILGILIVLPYEAEVTEMSVKLAGVIPLLQQACYYDVDKARTSMEERFLKSLIQLNRIAQGEVGDKRTGFRAKSGSIFNLGAEILQQSFEHFAKLCVIFDASSVRYIFSGSSNLSSNSVESSKGSAGSNCVSTTEMSSIKDE